MLFRPCGSGWPNLAIGAKIAVGFVGKIKTTLSPFIAISLLLMGPEVEGFFPGLICGELLFYVAGGLTLWSMVVYLRAAWPDLRDH
ncbi:MAG: hypothetical protein CM1200mP18_20250 [Gammaproteobacteria bacterium]|nr:MAG: hypothetical protein CM1200mP18_20250 [Gammaproteobacteria bacterium]